MPVLDIAVAASLDDVARWAAAGFATNSPGVTTGDVGGDSYHSAMRFLNITVPRGAKIIDAYITFYARGNPAGVVVRTNLAMEDADDPVRIATDVDFDGRARTAVYAWDGIGAWVDNTSYPSPSGSLTAAVQAVVRRAGWNIGQAMQVFWENDGSDVGDRRTGESFDGDPANPPVLHIEYLEPAVSNIPAIAVAARII